MRDLYRTFSLLGKKIIPVFLIALLTAVVIAFNFNIILAFIAKDVLDASVSGNRDLLVRALVMASACFAVGLPVFAGGRYLVKAYIKRMLTDRRVELFSRMASMPVGMLEGRNSGDTLSRMTNDLGKIKTVFEMTTNSLFVALMMGGIGIISIFTMDRRLGIAALVLGFSLLAASILLSKPIRRANDAVQESLGLQTERLTDLVESLAVAKLYHAEALVLSRYKEASRTWERHRGKSALYKSIFDALNTALDWISKVGLLILGLFFVSRGEIGLGVIMASTHLLGNASFLFSNLGEMVTTIQGSLAGAKRVFEFLDRPIENPGTGSGPIDDFSAGSMLEISGLSFHYESGGGIDDLNLEIKRGEAVALVGSSGSGKSTLLKVLLGLYPPAAGKIAICGRSIDTLSLENLRSCFAYVPQDAYLFDGTIAENIRYGKPDAGMDEIQAACRAAFADDFIESLENGYQTKVGERGAKLSGGQRQRIAIARALIKNSPILLLDEATSSLDSESEEQVQKALDVVMRGRTTVVVAHRLSTVRHADRILVLEKGRIAESGSHEELVSKNGLYKALYERQFQA